MEIAFEVHLFDKALGNLTSEERFLLENKYKDHIPVGAKLHILSNAIRNPTDVVERRLRGVLEKTIPEESRRRPFLEFKEPLEIRNNAAHQKCVCRDDFERSRKFVFNFLHALYNEK